VTSDELDPAKALRVMTRVNGEVRQDDTTDRLTWGFAWLINYISTFATLKPRRLCLDRNADRRRRPPQSRGVCSSPATSSRLSRPTSACCATRSWMRGERGWTRAPCSALILRARVHTGSTKLDLRARVSKDAGGRCRAAPCFETHRGADRSG